MTPGSVRFHLALVAGLLFLGCAGTPSPRTERADVALSRGNPERAFELYSAAQAERPEDPLLAEKVEMARRQAAEAHLDRSRKATEDGDYAAAVEELRLAERWAPGDERIPAQREAIEARRSRATRGAATAVTAARDAAKKGEFGAALASLERARTLYGDLPELVAAENDTKEAAASALSTRAGREIDGGHPALALLLDRAAAELTGAAPAGLESAKAAAEKALGLSVVVGPFRDDTGGRVVPTTFRRQVQDALADLLEGPLTSVTGEGTGDVLVSGTVKSLTLESDPPKTETRRMEFVSRVDRVMNPAPDRLRERVRNLNTRLDQAKRVHDAARDELDSLERLGGSAEIHSNRGRRFGPYSEAAYYRYLGEARSREASAKNTVDALEAEIRAAENQIEAEPDILEHPVKGRAQVAVTTYSRTATAVAEYQVAGPDATTRGDVTGTARAEDDAWAANPRAGLPANPKELPPDSDLAERAVADLASHLSTTVAARIGELRRGLLAAAERCEGAGDVAGGLDRYAAFLFAVPNGMDVERAAAVREIEARLGIRIDGTKLDLANLRIDTNH